MIYLTTLRKITGLNAYCSKRLNRETLIGRDTTRWFTSRGESCRVKSAVIFLAVGIGTQPHCVSSQHTYRPDQGHYPTNSIYFLVFYLQLSLFLYSQFPNQSIQTVLIIEPFLFREFGYVVISSAGSFPLRQSLPSSSSKAKFNQLL